MNSHNDTEIVARVRQMRQLAASLYATSHEIADRTNKLRKSIAELSLKMKCAERWNNLRATQSTAREYV